VAIFFCHIELAELLFNRQSQIPTNPFKTEDASTTVQHDNIFCHSEPLAVAIFFCHIELAEYIYKSF
jgi:hypothetical protein